MTIPRRRSLLLGLFYFTLGLFFFVISLMEAHGIGQENIKRERALKVRI
jgi:hypothetical protein